MTVDSSAIRAEFRDEEFWKRETPRFLIYARALLFKYRWRGSYRNSPAGGEEPHDYVLRAAELILSGTRNCPLDVESVPFVLGVIHSLVTHDAEKVENRLLYADVGDDEDSKGEESFVDNRVSVEEALTAADLARDFVQSLPDAYRPYVELLISGECASASECAERLNIPIAKIRVMDKAIRRRRRAWKGTPPH